MAELIEAKKNSTVLDLGCGNGALSRVLHNTGYSVKGMDASRELLDIAGEKNPDIVFIQADATNFSLETPVDVVFSNAVFHWIDRERQRDKLKCVYHALKEDGEFVFELGGYGNNRLIHNALEKAFSSYQYAYQMPFYFPTIGEYASLLEDTGFKVTFAALFDRPTELIKNQTVDNLRSVLYQDGKWYADYVRLRMRAVR